MIPIGGVKMKKDIWKKFAGKGYYIALVSCAVVIGICGYLYYRNVGDVAAGPKDDPAVDTLQQDTPAIATKPSEQSPAPSTSKPMKMQLPVVGQTVMEHSMDCLTYDPTTRDWRVHDGVDIAAESGTPVTAAADGTVYTVYQDDKMGTTVVIRHEGGYVSTYASLDPEVCISAGDQVVMGQTIGSVGRSALLESALGDHVHFCVALDDVSVDPLNLLE